MNETFPNKVRTCPACGHDSSRPDASLGTWVWESLRGGFDRCDNCCSSFSNTHYSPDQLGAWYLANFPYAMYNDPIKRWDAKDRVLNLQKKRWLPSKGDLVVDVGCAAGLFLESLKREFPSANYLGVEMTPEIADRMSGMNGIEVVTIDKISSKSVDYLCMWHMLEHSTNPQQMLQDVICLCKPNSRLLIAVPNREALGFEKRGHQWIWCQPPWVHCVHFTSAGLAALLKRSQLTNFTLCKRETLDAFHLAFLNRPDWIPLQDGLLKPAERNLSPKQKRFYYPLYSWECWYSSCNETRVALGKRLSEIVTPRKKQTELMCLVSVS